MLVGLPLWILDTVTCQPRKAAVTTFILVDSISVLYKTFRLFLACLERESAGLGARS